MSNDSRKILIVCNSPFQVVVACHIIALYYNDCEIDLVVSDQFLGSNIIAENAHNCGRFRNVYYIRNNKKVRKYSNFKEHVSFLLDRAREVVVNLHYSKIVSRNIYDDVLFTNVAVFSKLLISAVLRKNKACRFHLFEEGLGTYSAVFGNSDAPDTPYRKYIDNEGVFAKLTTLYLFNPEFLVWDFPPEKICRLPKLSKENMPFLTLANTLFGYENCKDNYDRKIIFFEESYFVEGDAVPDIEIVEKIAEKAGKDNIMIKVHPRNPVNRFKALGYKTNVDTFIPWELIVLNQSFDDKTLVTIASGAAINPYLYTGQNIRNFSLLNCLDKRPGVMSSPIGDIMMKAYRTYPEILQAPASFEEFLNKLTTC